MSEMRIQQKLNNLGNAIARLREALDEPPENPLLVDETIQRFEFTFELSLDYLREHAGNRCPRGA